MKNDRLLSILLILLDERMATAASLAKRLEVSQRTIYRDIDSLCASGIPVMSDSGPGGGYALHRNFRLDKSFFSGKELAALDSFAGEVERTVGDPDLASALRKIRGMGMAGNAAPQTTLRFSMNPWGNPLLGESHVEALRDACERHVCVELSYVDAKGAISLRVVEPRELIVSPLAYYLSAYCRLRNDFRMFKLSRMERVRMMDDRFDPAEHPFDPGRSDGWENDELGEVEIHVPPEVAVRALEAFPGALRVVRDDGWLSLRFTHPVGEYLAGILVALGAVRIERPLRLRELALSKALSFIDIYH